MDVLAGLLILAVPIALLVWALRLRKQVGLARAEVESQRQWAMAAGAEIQRLKGLFSEVIPLADQAERLRQEIASLQATAQAVFQRNAAAERDANAQLQVALQRHAAAEQEAVARVQAVRAGEAAALAEAANTQRSLSASIAELQRALNALEEQKELQDAGFYRPRYDLATSAEYQARLDNNHAMQQQMAKAERAVVCTTEWVVNGDARSGRKMVKDHIKLMLRAFNGECDAAVAKAKYNNAATMERRIRAAFDAINKVSESKSCSITQQFLDLKLAELGLTVEYLDKKQREAEEQRAIREQMKDEERAAKELEKAKDEAEREERRYQQALEKARREAEAATGKQRDALEQKIADLQNKLAEATAKQKAISQAQITSAGHVYVISNIGSFGEHVYKIGMTRRLEPMERVYELGDASVPFPFDVHAMVYTENAPELERTLHQRFHLRRVNRVNERKEFFRVDLGDIERAVREIVPTLPRHSQREVVFTYTAAAEEHRRSSMMDLDPASATSSSKPSRRAAMA